VIEWARSLAFHIGFFFGTALLAVVGLPLLVGSPRWPAGLAVVWCRYVVWLVRAVAGVRYCLSGDMPTGPAIIASKHQSAFETFLFLKLWPEGVYVLKRELLATPLVGWYMCRSGQIGIDRAGGSAALRAMLAAAAARAAAGRRLLIFPEGTRVSPGGQEPIKPGVAAIYARLGLPVVPVVLDSGLRWPPKRFRRRAGTVHVRLLPAIPPGLGRQAFEAALANALAAPPGLPATGDAHRR